MAFLNSLADFIGVGALGRGLGQAGAGGSAVNTVRDLQKFNQDQTNNLLRLRQEAISKGDTARSDVLRKIITDRLNTSQPTVEGIIGGEEGVETPKQIIGSAATTALTIGTLGSLNAAAKTGQLATKTTPIAQSQLAQFLSGKSGRIGSNLAINAAFGGTQALAEGEENPLKKAAVSGAVGTALGFPLDKLANQVAKVSSPLAAKLVNKLNTGKIAESQQAYQKAVQAAKNRDINVPQFQEKVEKGLLPLQRDAATPRYENISLSRDTRGDVGNYQEHIYQSPIKNTAGDVHFQGGGYASEFDALSGEPPRAGFPNYFAHSRIEDLGDNSTRRIIELQSDLFQKGRLENEMAYQNILANPREESIRRKLPYDKQVDYIKRIANSRMKQLKPYENTWHERVIQEEIKQAARDGKAKLQFPTGETAMKVEGLGDIDRWFTADNLNRQLAPDSLKVGMEVTQQGHGNHIGDSDRWIITDVLGDGKFKAVQKNQLELTLQNDEKLYNKYVVPVARGGNGEFYDITEEEIEKITNKALKDGAFSNYTESFDISGSVDKDNPIYKFYEGDIQKYLKRIAPESKRITDPQGVSWFELDVAKEAADRPVGAFSPLKETKSQRDISTPILEALEGRQTVSPQFIEDLTKQGSIRESERQAILKALRSQIYANRRQAGNIPQPLQPATDVNAIPPELTRLLGRLGIASQP